MHNKARHCGRQTAAFAALVGASALTSQLSMTRTSCSRAQESSKDGGQSGKVWRNSKREGKSGAPANKTFERARLPNPSKLVFVITCGSTATLAELL